MTIADEQRLIDAAIARAAAAAELPWPPAAPGPVPLERLIEAFALAHAEVPGLTRSAAALHLRAGGIDRPDLLGDDAPLAGFLYANAAGGCVLVRKDDPLARRRFTAAHELGHYLLHFQPQPADEYVQDDGTVNDDDPDGLAAMERQADLFAAAVLMPEAACRRIAQQHGPSFRYVEHRLAGELLVSREAARWRLRSLKLPAEKV